MSQKTEENVKTMLCDLVALDSINPMGLPTDRKEPVERLVADYLEEVFKKYDLEMGRQAVGPLHENLYVAVKGKTDGPALFFEAHMDTVPAADWADRALKPRVEGDLVYGRGSCDDKGSLTAMVLALLELIESGEKPAQPVILLAAADEESTGSGISHYIENTGLDFHLGIFGEPTGNVPVIQHKGVARWDITTHGKSAHTSQPQFGQNAIVDMTRVIDAIAQHQENIQSRFNNPLLDGSRITVTMIQGGRTHNAVPDECTIAVDFRVMPEEKPVEARNELINVLDSLDVELSHSEPRVSMRPVSTSPDDPGLKLVLDTCSEVLSREVKPAGAPYGTDASRMKEGVPCIIMGPGDIQYAHAIDERVGISEVLQATEIYHRCMLHDWTSVY